MAWSEPNSSAGNSNLDRLRFNSLRDFVTAAHGSLEKLSLLNQLRQETDNTILQNTHPQ
jgi:hypothetical protein